MKYLLTFNLLFLSFSAYSATWKKIYKSHVMTVTPEETSCPVGYIGVSALMPYTHRYFCVMKYEAKNDTFDTPVSTADKLPWVGLKQQEASSKCQSLGGGYDLISNEQWQTIARNIAGVSENWSNGVVASGELNRGHSDGAPARVLAAAADNLACSETDQICSDSSWNSQRRTHTLSNGNKIWDFSGNAYEWVSNITTNDFGVYVSYGAAGYMSQMSGGDMRQTLFGALGITICADPGTTPYCGMGYSTFMTPPYGILRGGHYSDTDKVGVFSTYMVAPSAADLKQGFRCVFVP